MSETKDLGVPPLEGWALILGASSGFGGATALTLARAGMNIIGLHLRDAKNADPLVEQIEALGREAWFFNMNAANADKRAQLVTQIQERFAERGKGEGIRVLLHSLAFGTLKPFLQEAPKDRIEPKNMDMTLDVMAHSLVYWTQEIDSRGMFSEHARVLAMTSNGSREVLAGYGAVSAAKSALESHCRQLAMELAHKGVTANAICAGVTDTPALRKIPNNEQIAEIAKRKVPTHRLTLPQDVAYAIAAIVQPCTYWMTGNVIFVDGGESHCG